MFWKLTLAIVIVAGLGGAVYLSGVSKAQVKDAWKSLSSNSSSSHESKQAAEKPPHKIEPVAPWDGFVSIDKNKEAAIGLHLAPVMAQTEPIKLELSGRTAYDPGTLTKVRPRFDTLVVKVHATLGQKVSKGDSLVDLYSTELALAKN